VKPLIICGGCSFTHAPDSWAQVLGNYKGIWHDQAQKHHRDWKKYGTEIAETNMDHIPDNLYELWEEGEDITKYADVMIVGQGASGNGLNSRILRHAIEQNAGRQIIVLWQLSSWSRNEYAINRHDTLDYDTIINENDAHHMYSIPYAKRFRNCAHIDGNEHDPLFPVGWGYDFEKIENEDYPATTPSPYMAKERVWLKQGGTYDGWRGRHLFNVFKEYHENLNTVDYQSIINLETIEYMKLFCKSRDAQLLIFPGWYWCWEGMFNFINTESTLCSKDILDRVGLSGVDNINDYNGIAEYGIQSEVYTTSKATNHNPEITLKNGSIFTANETSSIYEKAKLDNGEWWCGNHPSAYNHAKFCNDWLKPKVKQMLDNIT